MAAHNFISLNKVFTLCFYDLSTLLFTSRLLNYLFVDYSKVKDSKKAKDRKLFDGWNNLTTFERDQLQSLYQEMKKSGKFSEIAPSDFPERDYLRFLQAYEFNLKKVVPALENYFQWRIRTLPCKLTSDTIKLIVNSLIN